MFSLPTGDAVPSAVRSLSSDRMLAAAGCTDAASAGALSLGAAAHLGGGGSGVVGESAVAVGVGASLRRGGGGGGWFAVCGAGGGA